MTSPAIRTSIFTLFTLATLALGGCGAKQTGSAAEPADGPAPADELGVGASAGAHDIAGEEVTYEADGVTMKGYLAYDRNQEGARPGVLVVHEWWGHNEYARKRARMLAELGYTALAVDMYGDGKVATHPEEAGQFAGAVAANVEGARARFEKALEVLRAHETTDAEDTAAIGYCFGGGIVLHMARAGLDLDGVASFHGSVATQTPAQPGQVQASVLVLHGAEDPMVTPEHIEGFKKEMDAAGVDYELVAYEGATHSFTSPDADKHAEEFGLPLAYHPEADAQSWAKMQEFLGRIFAD